MSTSLLDPPVDDLTRRRLLGTGAGLALALAACGRDTGTAPAAAAPGFPRTVSHEVGDTTLDRPPARIVSVTDGAELGALLALGLTPVAFGQRNDPLLPWISQAGAENPAIERFDLPSAEVDFEQLATLRPDVVIGQKGFVTEDNIATFQGVAPTVATSFMDWRESLRQVAEATGTQDRATRVAADLDAQIDAVSRLTDLAGLRVAIFSVYEGNEIYALNDASPAAEILSRRGAAPLLVQRTDAQAAELISPELAGTELECDLALIQFYTGSGRAGYDTARAAGIFDSITAFRTGRVVELSDVDSQAISFSSVLTVPWNIAFFERVLGT